MALSYMHMLPPWNETLAVIDLILVLGTPPKEDGTPKSVGFGKSIYFPYTQGDDFSGFQEHLLDLFASQKSILAPFHSTGKVLLNEFPLSEWILSVYLFIIINLKSTVKI